jgi:hypothetical protein
MKCSDARRKLSALLDGADEASLRDVVARHVDGCVPCRAELDALAGVDRLVASGLRAAVQSAPPPHYHEEFWPRLSARLDEESQEGDAMSMSTSSEDRSQGQKAAASPAGGGGEKSERQEVSGLHDIRALAASTIQRHSKEISVGEVADALMASASPATLGQVVLPAPGKEVASVVASSKVALSDAPPAPSSGWGRSLAVGALMLAAGFGIAFLVFREPRKDQAAGTPANEAAPSMAAGSRADTPAQPAPSEPSVVAASSTDPQAGSSGSSAAGEKAAGGGDETKPTEVAMADTKPAPRDAKTDKPAATRPDKPDKAVADRSKADAKPDTADTAKPDDTKPDEGGGGGAAAGGGATPKEEPKKNPSIEDIFNAPAGGGPAAEKPVETKPAADAEGPTELTNDEVKKGMGSIKARVQDCYAKFKVAGTVTVSVTIEPDGIVTKAVAVDDKFANTDTGFCVAEAVSHAVFKKWNGPARTVRYPFRLQ